MEYSQQLLALAGLSPRQRLGLYFALIREFNLIGRMIANDAAAAKGLAAIVEVQARLASQIESEMLGVPDYPDPALVELIFANIENPILTNWTHTTWSRGIEAARRQKFN